MENKRTIQQLLALRGSAVDGEVSYFFKEPPEHPIIPDKTSYKDSHNRGLQGTHFTFSSRAHTLLCEVVAPCYKITLQRCHNSTQQSLSLWTVLLY